MNEFDKIMENIPNNETIYKSFIKTYNLINNSVYNKIICSISGGSDSDIILDLVKRCDIDNKVDFVYFDTGLEYKATKNHIQYLQNKYCIDIMMERSQKPVAVASKLYGVPFISKRVSDYINRLQSHNFDWKEDGEKSLTELVEKYCVWNEKRQTYVGCFSALRWWTNNWDSNLLNINGNKYLKEFLIENPPTFKISSKCCLYAKENLIRNLLKDKKYELNIYGVRKAEGGARKAAYKSCFDDTIDKLGFSSYRPIFYYTNKDKKIYEDFFNIIHSDCYTKYNLRRTGCCSCPFGRNYKEELEAAKENEPNLYIAVQNIFKDSYEYTEKYKQFKEERKKYENK